MCRCDERVKAKTERATRLVYTGFRGGTGTPKDRDEVNTRLVYTGFRGGLEHLKIETRLIDEMITSVMGECVILTPQVRRRYSK